MTHSEVKKDKENPEKFIEENRVMHSVEEVTLKLRLLLGERLVCKILT